MDQKKQPKTKQNVVIFLSDYNEFSRHALWGTSTPSSMAVSMTLCKLRLQSALPPQNPPNNFSSKASSGNFHVKFCEESALVLQ